MRRFEYEVLLGDSYISPADWHTFCLAIQHYLGSLHTWSLQIHFEHYVVHYYLISYRPLPSSLHLQNFLLKPATLPTLSTRHPSWPLFQRSANNCVELATYLQRHQQTLCAITIQFNGLYQGIIGLASAVVCNSAGILHQHILFVPPATLLSVDFAKNRNFIYKKIPKYLKLDKTVSILQPNAQQSLLQIDTFPYQDSDAYLQLTDYDFARHSLVLGSSGMGKSKFIATVIQQLYADHPEEYQIIVIDPHDALKVDLASIANRIVVDFTTPKDSIDLFATTTQNLSANIELLLNLFRSLLTDNYNSRLERVLRYSIYLLSVAQSFTFATLRQLLIDLDYRQQLLKKWQRDLPASVLQFFLADFQELKIKSYSEAVAPIIAFIDEMQMVPTFNQVSQTVGLAGALQDTFLVIFSLNRLQFGDKVVRTLAGLLMQQIFLLAQSRAASRRLLIIIDEVAVVENPILPRFLSELRKYGVSVILAGQYFAQASPELQASIFANTANYYLFRVSRTDANLLSQNLEIKLVGSDAPEDQAKLLSGLGSRECLVQVSREGKILPIFKARTLDFPDVVPVPAKPIPCIVNSQTLEVEPESDFDFAFDDADIGDFLSNLSTSRKLLN